MTFRETDVLASILKDSFYEFLKEFWDTIVGEEFVENWHIRFLCDEAQTVMERVFANKPKEYDLVVNVAPGSTKSTIFTQALPAWAWIRMATCRGICGSYAHQVALKDSLKTRDVVQSEKYQSLFPGIQLREDENTKGLFTNTHMGSRLSVSVGGFVTGYHAHFHVVDDPLNPEEALSEVGLKTANRWMKTTLSSRKVDKLVTPLILVMQRLAEEDPSGQMLVKQKAKVRHICLPGELREGMDDKVSPPELKRFYIGGLFDPVRLPKSVLEEMEEELGAYGYAAQVLQEPIPLTGGFFDVARLNLVDDPPGKFVREVRSWDKAGTQDGGKYSVGVRMGMDAQRRFCITDVQRGQWAATQREARILATAEEDGDELDIVLEIEGGSGGKESGENTVRMLAGWKVIAFHPTGDKESRAYPFASQVGAGNVYVLKRKWTKAYVEELRHFSNIAKYSDQVDASSGAFNRIAKKKKRAGGW